MESVCMCVVVSMLGCVCVPVWEESRESLNRRRNVEQGLPEERLEKTCRSNGEHSLPRSAPLPRDPPRLGSN